MSNIAHWAAVILAAGHGTRMNSATPKVLLLFHSQPLLEYVVRAVEQSDPPIKPVVVVNAHAKEIEERFKNRVQCVVQREQLGTGHAVQAAETALRGRVDNIVVLPGDMPNISAAIIQRFLDTHLAEQSVVTFATTTVPDFTKAHGHFSDFGRVVRDANGKVVGIREYKDASDSERQIKEVNTGWFCFAAEWLWEHLRKIENNNEQKEYYLVDLVELAVAEKKTVATIMVTPRAAWGVNTPEQLEFAQSQLLTPNS